MSRTLRTPLILTLALCPLACGDDATGGSATLTSSPSDTSGMDSMDSLEGMDSVGDGDGDTGDGDGDSGDGDGDSGDGDGDGDTGDGDGDGDTGDGDGDGDTGDGDGDGDTDPMPCIDNDQDGYGIDCDLGPDCDDDDPNNYSEEGCANCSDADMDGQWVGCDIFGDDKPGEDCDDNNYNVFTPDGCANCSDVDMDGFWVGCDQYSDDNPGPDCDDDNPNVGIDDVQEICNGLSENCAGEIDNLPAHLMCPPDGQDDPPNLANANAWACDPPAPGQDGCVILNCAPQYFDLDLDYQNGCECAGTTRSKSLASCSFLLNGYVGAIAEGNQAQGLPLGSIPDIDNGIGAGAEDWYWAEFNELDAMGARPHTGILKVSFAQNDNNDYRFEVFDSCQGVAWDNGLAIEFGAGAPPSLEWWFSDTHAEPMLMNNYDWPETVFIRVFRVQNDQTCNNYQLTIQRTDN